MEPPATPDRLLTLVTMALYLQLALAPVPVVTQCRVAFALSAPLLALVARLTLPRLLVQQFTNLLQLDLSTSIAQPPEALMF